MNLPTTIPAQRIATLFHRRLTTPWSSREVRAFKELFKSGIFKDEDSMLLLERYYSKNWPPRTGQNILRHDLQTLLINLPSEIDRARIWCEAHPIRSKVVKFTVLQKETEETPEDIERRKLIREQCMTEFKKSINR